jgi:hypothetical protein
MLLQSFSVASLKSPTKISITLVTVKIREGIILSVKCDCFLTILELNYLKSKVDFFFLLAVWYVSLT